MRRASSDHDVCEMRVRALLLRRLEDIQSADRDIAFVKMTRREV
jgi:hypothetical protein